MLDGGLVKGDNAVGEARTCTHLTTTLADEASKAIVILAHAQQTCPTPGIVFRTLAMHALV